MHVLKLGGSLLQEPRTLNAWLETIATAGQGRLVVVPGGGPFVDAVRATQARLGFDESAAHRMALLGMEQCAWLLASLAPACVPAASMSAISKVLASGRVPIWMPTLMLAESEGIPESWSVTSDSLAAWLARALGASALWLVKACPVPVQDPERLAGIGVVDPIFPRFCAEARFDVHVLGPRDRVRFTAALAQERVSPAPAGAP
jgi:dihydroneopterin aldolase